MKTQKFLGIIALTFSAICFLGLAVDHKEAVAQAAPALAAPQESPGAVPNSIGMRHYRNRAYGSAEEHFQKAIDADAKLAEAHYNLGLSLDQLGLHKDATDEFKKALEFAPDNPKIADSTILKKHLGMD